jgi:hypothetical protein
MQVVNTTRLKTILEMIADMVMLHLVFARRPNAGARLKISLRAKSGATLAKDFADRIHRTEERSRAIQRKMRTPFNSA